MGEDAKGQRAPLLLVEDDADIRGMVAEYLGGDYAVTETGTAEQGLELALRSRFAVMVFDRRLPGMDGVALIRAVRRAGIRTPVLMLTALGSVDDRVSGLDGGANDYLVKPFDFEELAARLRSLRRAFAAEAERRGVGDWQYLVAMGVLYGPGGERVTLTPTENALLDALSEDPDRVLSRDSLLASVFHPGDQPGIVDTYVHYLREKLGRDAVETVRGHGYRLGTS
jgi:two-component system response regulator QseB